MKLITSEKVRVYFDGDNGFVDMEQIYMNTGLDICVFDSFACATIVKYKDDLVQQTRIIFFKNIGYFNDWYKENKDNVKIVCRIRGGKI